MTCLYSGRSFSTPAWRPASLRALAGRARVTCALRCWCVAQSAARRRPLSTNTPHYVAYRTVTVPPPDTLSDHRPRTFLASMAERPVALPPVRQLGAQHAPITYSISFRGHRSRVRKTLRSPPVVTRLTPSTLHIYRTHGEGANAENQILRH
jgi:hypothetical protein